MTNLIDLEFMEEIKELADKEKIHPWRLCPLGKHLVREHLEHISPSKVHPKGEVILRAQHCATNPSKKDLLSFDEMQHITKTHFSNLLGSPTVSEKLTTLFPKANDYDEYIRGWVNYWNDIFDPEEPLNPNLVKALIATESGFNANTDFQTKELGHVRGLMQITGKTLEIITNHDSELRNHLFKLSGHDLLDPSANICVGVRWLFRKKDIATEVLKHKATWIEAVASYKSYLGKKPEPKPMKNLRKYYKLLQEESR